jgi:hypothetical protein
MSNSGDEVVGLCAPGVLATIILGLIVAVFVGSAGFVYYGFTSTGAVARSVFRARLSCSPISA